MSLSPLSGNLGPLGGLKKPAGGLTFLFRDDFSINRSGPFTFPFAADGVGTWDSGSDPNGYKSISGGELLISGINSVNDYLFCDTPFARKKGLLAYFRFRTHDTGSVVAEFGMSGTVDTVPALNFRGNPTQIGTAIALRSPVGIQTITSDSLITDTYADLYIIQQTIGVYYIFNTHLVFAERFTNIDPLFFGQFYTNSITGLDMRYTTARLIDLEANGLTAWSDNNVLTQFISGSVSVGTTFAHDADFSLQWIHTSRGSVGNTLVDFRITQSSPLNCWRVKITSAGTMTLHEVTGGIESAAVATLGVAITNGQTICIRCTGTRIRFGRANVQLDYTAANDYQTGTSGNLNTLATGGVVTDLYTFPYDLTLPSHSGLLDILNQVKA